MNVVSPALSPASIAALPPIRVMVVDDAVVMRSLVTRWVTESPDLVMAGAVKSGREAINELERANPDVVVLDVDMPELDGISTLPLLLEKKRDLTVLMASSLTRHNAEITLKALSLGAADYIPKPDNEGGIMTSASFQRELIEKIRVLGARRTRRMPSPSLAPVSPPAARPASSRLMPANDSPRIGRRHISPSGGEPSIIRLRPFSCVIPRVLLIGASTGGPNALVEMLPKMLSVMENAPVLITQHMPPTFTIILAEHLSRACGKQVHEAVDGEPVLTGSTYLAPGGRHMRVARRAGVAVIALDDSPPVNFCKPSVDPLFASAAEVWGAWNLALVMTGMGSDGAHGAADVVAAGGSVIAQDEATSVIWGMPGAVAEAGLCSAVLALHHIAPTAVRLFQGGRP